MKKGAEIMIEEVKNPSGMKRFVRLPYDLYRGNEYWVPPLIQDETDTLNHKRNPAFRLCSTRFWIALKNNRPVGRIAGIIHPSESERERKRIARFGWFDFIDDPEVSSALIRVFENWALENGISEVHGPMGFSDLDPQGFLVEGFNEKGTLATIYNHSYYASHLDSQGYSKKMDWVEFDVKIDGVPERIEKWSRIIRSRLGLKTVPIEHARDVLPYAHQIFDLINEGYDGLYGYLPLTPDQIDYYTKKYLNYVVPGLLSLVLNPSRELIGFALTLPSLSEALRKANGRLFPFGMFHLLRALKKNDKADMYLIAIRPDYQGKGVHAVIFEEILRGFVAFGITRAETNIELEVNHRVQALWSVFETRQHKRRRAFYKRLTE